MTIKCTKYLTADANKPIAHNNSSVHALDNTHVHTSTHTYTHTHTHRSVHAMPEGLQGMKVMQIFVYLRSCAEDNQYAHPLDLVPFVDVLQGKVG